MIFTVVCEVVPAADSGLVSQTLGASVSTNKRAESDKQSRIYSRAESSFSDRESDVRMFARNFWKCRCFRCGPVLKDRRDFRRHFLREESASACLHRGKTIERSEVTLVFIVSSDTRDRLEFLS